MNFENFTLFNTDCEKPKSVLTCCVSNCEGTNDGTVMYHQFPKPGQKVVVQRPNGGPILICDRRKIWEDRVCVDQTITKYARVCSLHFTPDDYSDKTKMKKCRRRLKNTAVPSLNLPEEHSAFVTFKQREKVSMPNNNYISQKCLVQGKRKSVESDEPSCTKKSTGTAVVLDCNIKVECDIVKSEIETKIDIEDFNFKCEEKIEFDLDQIFLLTSFEAENILKK